jgi:hypothetical protein
MRTPLMMAAALTGLGCGSFTGPLSRVPDGAFTTDAASYVARPVSPGTARYEFDVATRFENRTRVTLYLGRCYPDSPQPMFGVELVEPAGRESGYSMFWACVGHDRQFVVRPGEVRIDTLHIAGPNMFDGATQQPIGVTEGVFRLSFDVRTAPDYPVTAAPLDVAVSNEFVVRRRDR